MSNFKIQFLISPWLLLLIVPALAVTFWFYFRLDKRYRKTRSRVVSIIFHTIVMVLCICVLSGMYFTLEQPNVQNELVLLVDSSYTTENAQNKIDDFVYDILKHNKGRNKLAIVKFGYDQKVALEMGKYDAETAYSRYLSAETPNATASDISAALSFCWNPQTKKSGGDSGIALIHHPESARILLISDGLETDQDAVTMAKRIALQGVQIDTTFYPGSNNIEDASIVNVSFPNKNFGVGEEFNFTLTVRSSFAGAARIKLVDESAQASLTSEPVEPYHLVIGTQTITFPHSFSTIGFHSLKFQIECANDSLAQNNVYYTYYTMQDASNILIIEKYTDESTRLSETLTSAVDSQTLHVTTVQIGDTLRVPSSVEAMQDYSEIILVNIAHSDMPAGFEENLEKYVRVVGGGLLTVGGFELDSTGNVITDTNEAGTAVPRAHAYREEDMKDTTYQSMLPVDAVNYTPSIALALIIDCSGSMDKEDTMGTKLDIAIKSSTSLLEELSPKDYVAVMALKKSYSSAIDFTPLTQKDKIANAIRGIATEAKGATNYESAIQFACRGLSAFSNDVRKHILLISDGQPGDTYDEFGKVMEVNNKNNGITITVISINHAIDPEITKLETAGCGKAHRLTAAGMGRLGEYLMDDLGFLEVSGAVPSDYSPIINRYTSVTGKINQSQLSEIQLHGFFGTRTKSIGDVEVSLMALYSPLYAQWNYGNGKVGSFMCDLNGHWSKELFNSTDVGVPIIQNMVTSVLPTANVQTRSLDATFTEDNYRTQVNVRGFDQQDETDYKLIAIIQPPKAAGAQTAPQPTKIDLSELSMSGNRFTFENLEAGIHEVTILKVQKSFNINSITSLDDIPESQIFAIFQSYRAFSYSKEYDSTLDPFATGRELLMEMSTRKAEDPEDKLVDTPAMVLDEIMDIHREWHPRLLFTIISLVLFLLDIAVRKFSFLWPHEIIRKLRRKKNPIEQQTS